MYILSCSKIWSRYRVTGASIGGIRISKQRGKWSYSHLSAICRNPQLCSCDKIHTKRTLLQRRLPVQLATRTGRAAVRFDVTNPNWQGADICIITINWRTQQKNEASCKADKCSEHLSSVPEMTISRERAPRGPLLNIKSGKEMDDGACSNKLNKGLHPFICGSVGCLGVRMVITGLYSLFSVIVSYSFCSWTKRSDTNIII